MIPGLSAVPGLQGAGSTGSGSGGALSFTAVNFSTSSGTSITIPANAAAGDWAALVDFGILSGGGSISPVTPSGWTNVANASGSFAVTVRMMVSHRILTAGMAGTSVTGLSATARRKIMLVFRPSTSIVSVVASTWNAQATSGDPSSQTVTASGVTAPLIVIAAAGTNAGTPPFSTETPSMTNVTMSDVLRVGYTIYNSSPANQSVDMGNLSNGNCLVSGYMGFT